MITTKDYTIPIFMTDRYGNLSTRHLASLMFEVSFLQASEAEANIDMDKLRWVVYSWNLDIIEPIFALDEVSITTMSLDMKKFYAYRNFTVKKAGKIIARAYVEFLLIDIERMRPVKTFDQLKNAYGSEEAIYLPDQITYRDDFTEQKIIQIRRADIDSNFHVNNAAYFDYITDLIGLDSKDISHFKIVYKNEIRNKDAVIGEFVAYDGEFDFRLRSTEDDTIYTYGKVKTYV